MMVEKQEHPFQFNLLSFDEVLPGVLDRIIHIINSKLCFWHKLFSIYPRDFLLTCNQIQAKIPEWASLSKQTSRKVVFHTYRMIYSLVQDHDFNTLSSSDQNILLWCALLHDVKKLGKPILCGKDHCHPFKSGYAALLIFESLGFVHLTSQNKLEWDDIFSRAYNPFPKEKHNSLHNNEAALPIYTFLCKIFNNDTTNSVMLVILLITFHQSLYLLRDYAPMTPLDFNSSQSIFSSDHLLDLMLMVTVHDSYSYLLFKCYAPSLTAVKQEAASAIDALKIKIKKAREQVNTAHIHLKLDALTIS